MHDQSASPNVAATPPSSVILMVRHNQQGQFDVVAGDVLIHQHGAEHEAHAHCRRLQAQQNADLSTAP
jgi:hypothetical protein